MGIQKAKMHTLRLFLRRFVCTRCTRSAPKQSSLNIFPTSPEFAVPGILVSRRVLFTHPGAGRVYTKHKHLPPRQVVAKPQRTSSTSRGNTPSSQVFVCPSAIHSNPARLLSEGSPPEKGSRLLLNQQHLQGFIGKPGAGRNGIAQQSASRWWTENKELEINSFSINLSSQNNGPNTKPYLLWAHCWQQGKGL